MAKNSSNNNQLNKNPVKSTVSAEEVIPLSNSGSGETPGHDSNIPDANNRPDSPTYSPTSTAQIAESGAPATSPGLATRAPATANSSSPDSAKPDPTRYGDWVKNGRCIDF